MMAEDGENLREDEPAEIGDAAEAFAALRRTVEKQGAVFNAEMIAIRPSLEEIVAKFEAMPTPTDHDATLGTIARELRGIGQRLQAIENQPALKTTPAEQARAIEEIGRGMVRNAVSNLNKVIQTSTEEREQLARIVGQSREQTRQRKWLMGTALAGLVAGFGLFALLMNLAPTWVRSPMAAITVGTIDWNGSIDTIGSNRSDDQIGVGEEGGLANALRQALNECRKAVYESGEAQDCVVKVEPGG